jgi:hypothetical protein
MVVPGVAWMGVVSKEVFTPVLTLAAALPAPTAVTGKDRKKGSVVGLFDQPSGSGWSLPTCIRLLWTARDVGYLE